MSKNFALLIGVSEYISPELPPLKCPLNGVDALYDVLTNPAIGDDFSPKRVTPLPNPGVGEMQNAIAKLFSQCSHKDLVLLYFTGHGIVDEHNDLFFTTCETNYFDNKKLNRGSTVSAKYIRDEMKKCSAQRQIVILDCCFSGIFADGVMSNSESININIKEQLGGEGRVILTATNSTQYAREEPGAKLSVYTNYLVQGLKTGAAAAENREVIYTEDIHKYICNQLETTNFGMSPQRCSKVGLEDIVLLRVLNSEQKFRKRVQQYLQNGQISTIANSTLSEFAKKLKMTAEQAEKIITEESERRSEELTQLPVQGETPLNKYRAVFQAEANECYPLSEQSLRELHDYQEELGLSDKDVASIRAEREREYQKELKTKQNQTGWYERFFGQGQQISFKVMGCGVMTILLFIILYIIWQKFIKDSGNPAPTPPTTQTALITPITRLISAGDNKDFYGRKSSGKTHKYTYKDDVDKGITEFFEGRYGDAQDTFSKVREKDKYSNSYFSPRKDPETLIFQNNSQARNNAKGNLINKIYTIAVAVPLSYKDGKPFSTNIGQQVLFGVAQAQTLAINKGINLEVVIANDLNDPTQAKELAQELSKPLITGYDNKNREILAVIGHYSSTVTCAALPAYNDAGLAIISPLSTRTNIRECYKKKDDKEKKKDNKVFFRTISSSDLEAKALTDYLDNKIKEPKKIIVFYNYGEGFSKNLFDRFRANLKEEIDKSNIYNLSDPNDVKKGKENMINFNVIAVFPDGQTADSKAFSEAIGVIGSRNAGGLILGSNPLNDGVMTGYNGLKVSEANPNKGLILAIDWIPTCGANPKFVNNARAIWGGWPTRVTAASSEAVQVLVDRINVIKKEGVEINRSNILSSLRMPTKIKSNVFQNKNISFKPNGDRQDIETRILVTPLNNGNANPGFAPVEKCNVK